MKPSPRSQVDPFIVMDVMEAARRAEEGGRHIIHMEVGQPGTPAPKGAQRAVAAAMESDALGYTVALGLPALRERIAKHYGETYDVDLDPGRVAVTCGSSGAFILAFAAMFQTGDRVGLGAPGYPSYRQILRAMDLNVVEIPTKLENRLQPVAADIPDDLRGLIVASPSNPSGTILPRHDLESLIERATEFGAGFISDEIYHGLHYGEPAISALEISDDVAVINSFSKYYSMTGWRVGWMIMPDTMMRTVERLAQNLFICPPHVSQVAALAAMECGEELEANRAVYRANRDLMIAGLKKSGFTKIAPPDGAFYVYADVSDYTNNSLQFAKDILDQAGVAVTPGLDFDPERGHHWLRFSYARSTEDVEEGLSRLTEFMSNRL